MITHKLPSQPANFKHIVDDFTNADGDYENNDEEDETESDTEVWDVKDVEQECKSNKI